MSLAAGHAAHELLDVNSGRPKVTGRTQLFPTPSPRGEQCLHLLPLSPLTKSRDLLLSL